MERTHTQVWASVAHFVSLLHVVAFAGRKTPKEASPACQMLLEY